MPDEYVNIFFQIALLAMIIAYLTRYAQKQEPEVNNILRAIKSRRFDRAFEIAVSKIRAVDSSDYSYQQKEMFYIRFRKVIEYLEKKIAKEEDAELLNALGWSYVLTKDYERALRHLRKAEEMKCSDPSILLNIAVAMKGLNWHRKALTYFRKALVLDPDNLDALLGKAEMSFVLEMCRSAKESYSRVLELDDDNVKAIYGYAMCCFQFEEYKEAFKHFKRIEKRGYKEAVVSYCIGKIYYIENNFSKAMEYLDRATAADYFYAEAYYLKSIIYAIEKKRELSIQNLANAVKTDDTYKEQAKKERLFETYWLYNDFKVLFE